MANDTPHVETRYLDPVRAELRVHVPWDVSHAGELHGRLMGPRCPFASTVEVAYPLKPIGPRELQAIIPEPSWWEPACPFLYEGPLEYRIDGQVRKRAWLSHGLRTLSLAPRGLSLNGRPLSLRGLAIEHASEADLSTFREKGYNALLAPATRADLWPLADRLGFLMLGRIDPGADVPAFSHVSTLGWLFESANFRPSTTAPFRGLSLPDLPRTRLPEGVDFLLVPGPLAEELRPAGLPLLVWQDADETTWEGPSPG